MRATAISNQPGAYFKCRWRGPLARVLLTVDTSASPQPFLTLTYAFDSQAASSAVFVPPGMRHAQLSLVPEAPVAASTAATAVADDECSESEQHTLVVHILASVQQLDRWGFCPRWRQNGSPAVTPPLCSLRLEQVELPMGATAVMPALNRRRMIAFGCSITEGVCAGFEPSIKGGDLEVNASKSAWAATTAECLGAEYSNVGFGRQGW